MDIDLGNLDKKMGNISLSAALLIFYISIANQYTGDLMGVQLKEFLRENRIVQHIIAFVSLLVLIIFIGKIYNLETALLYAGIGYAWFILTTKLDIQWNMIVLFMLIIGFMYECRTLDKESSVSSDTVLTKNEKQNIIDTHNNNKTYIVGGIMLVTVIGFALYSNKKMVQYGGSFDLVKFFLY